MRIKQGTVKFKILEYLKRVGVPCAVHEIPFSEVGANQCTVSRELRYMENDIQPSLVHSQWRKDAQGHITYKEWYITYQEPKREEVIKTEELEPIKSWNPEEKEKEKTEEVPFI